MPEAKELRKGQFGHPETTQRQGRPKGSKNRINALKLMAEQSALEDNASRLQEVLEGIIEDALNGDRACRKMVWDALMSKGLTDAAKGSEKLEIKIGRFEAEPPKDIEGEVEIIQVDDNEEYNEEPISG